MNALITSLTHPWPQAQELCGTRLKYNPAQRHVDSPEHDTGLIRTTALQVFSENHVETLVDKLCRRTSRGIAVVEDMACATTCLAITAAY